MLIESLVLTMNNHNRLAWWLGALLLTAVTILLLGYYLSVEKTITGGVIGAPLDDVWIHFQFARNLSQGQGFSFNPGQPTPGSTAPLWTIILAAASFFSADFLTPALGLSAVFFLAAVLLAYGFSAWITENLWPALLAGLAVALSGRLLWAGLAGMETTAFAALSLAAIWAYSRSGLRLFPALLFGLASQLRPEGHALFALAFSDAAWQWFRIEHSRGTYDLVSAVRRFLPPLGLYLLLALPYTIFSFSITGRPLPNTFYAKVSSQYFVSWRTLRETLSWHWQDNPISLLLACFGLWPMWRKSRLGVLWLLVLPLLTAVIIDFTWHHGRYTMPLIPLQMVTAAVGAWWLVNKLPARGEEVFPWRLLAQGGLFCLLLLGGLWRFSYWATMLGTNTREIQEIDVSLGRWLAENTPQEALIAVDDIGAIAFISGRQIVDMNGLVSPEVWPAVNAAEDLERDQVLTRVLSQAQPDYMAAFPLWRWNIASNPDVAQPLHHVRTGTHTIIFQQDAYVYETAWPYLAAAEAQHEQSAVFGERIKLLGYDLAPAAPDELVLYWESLTPTAEDYDVFVHLRDESGGIATQVDRQPLSGLAPTSIWEQGDIIRDPITLPETADLAPGEYDILVGFFLRETGQRLAISGVDAPDNALLLDTITIP
jgi:arabinofuranosyltransferase